MEGRRTLRQVVRTSYMVLEGHHFEHLPYGYHQGVVDKERTVDKHQVVQEDTESR